MLRKHLAAITKPIKAKPLPKVAVKTKGLVAIGFDLSLSSLAGCIKFRDLTAKKINGPEWTSKRWPKGTAHEDKLREVAKAHEFVFDLLAKARALVELDEVFIGVEEVPISKLSESQRVREQCEIVGAFFGGLLRYGYKNVFKVNPKSWQALVAADLDRKANKEFTKLDVKDWAIEVYDAPRWRDLIRNGKLGLVPRPKGSKAQAIQPDDRYDATGIMEYVWERAHKI